MCNIWIRNWRKESRWGLLHFYGQDIWRGEWDEYTLGIVVRAWSGWVGGESPQGDVGTGLLLRTGKTVGEFSVA